jgi:phosphodiesterase/alkaline phosphatase D-like protein
MHHVLLNGLSPGVRYWYSVGQRGGNLSAPRAFTAPLAPGDPSPFEFALFGDMALSPWPGAWSTVDNIVWADTESRAAGRGGVRFVAHTGDLGYAMGSTLIWGL